jgi:hypothetical protein
MQDIHSYLLHARHLCICLFIHLFCLHARCSFIHLYFLHTRHSFIPSAGKTFIHLFCLHARCLFIHLYFLHTRHSFIYSYLLHARRSSRFQPVAHELIAWASLSVQCLRLRADAGSRGRALLGPLPQNLVKPCQISTQTRPNMKVQ